MNETAILLREIEALIDARPMAETTFGRKAVNDTKLIRRLRSGGTVTIEKAACIRAFIRERYESPSEQARA